MSRTYRALSTLALSLALAGTVATAALAAPPTGSTGSPTASTADINAQRKALYQSELEHNQAAAAAGTQAAVEQARAGEREFAATAAQPAARAEDQNDRLLRSIEAAQAERTQAAVEQVRAGERNLVPVVTITAPQPVQAAPSRDVDVVAITLLGLIGGLIGGGAVVAGAAANRRRHRVVAA
jgi:hypothetical protein